MGVVPPPLPPPPMRLALPPPNPTYAVTLYAPAEGPLVRLWRALVTWWVRRPEEAHARWARRLRQH